MMNTSHTLLVTGLLLCLGAVQAAPRGSVQVDRGDQESWRDDFLHQGQLARFDRNRGGADQGKLMPLDRAVSMVQSRFNATAVKTDTVNESGQVLYRIRLISADRARVWTVTVDARSGQVY